MQLCPAFLFSFTMLFSSGRAGGSSFFGLHRKRKMLSDIKIKKEVFILDDINFVDINPFHFATLISAPLA